MVMLSCLLKCYFLNSIATVMKDSGCEVPEYMLEMKKVTKKVRKERENRAPERESISTVPKREKQKQENLQYVSVFYV